MNVKNVGGVLVAGGLALLLFYGVAFIYWVSNTGALMTKLLLLTGVIALGVGAALFGFGSAGRRR
jgi:uncharacterized membrane protein